MAQPAPRRAGKAAPKGNPPKTGKSAPSPRASSKPSALSSPSAPAKVVDPLRIVFADFLAGAGPGSALPAPTHAEIAFAGRSNVGKSSLINTLVERRSLVRTSSNPGSTRQLNLYEARAADTTVFHLVDLPGYGFTRRSKSEKASWGALIEGYLTERSTLTAVVLLCDVRRGLEDDDHALIEFIDAAESRSRRPVEVLVVATKLDKLPKSARKSALAAVERAAGLKVCGFSSETAEGRPELWRALRRASLGQVVPRAGEDPVGEDPVGEDPVGDPAIADQNG